MGKLLAAYYLGGFVSLVTIVNPASKIPLFLALSADMGEAERLRTARQACLYALALLVASLFAGVLVLETFGISYGALRIAGGLTIAILGYRMLFGSPDPWQGGGQGRANVAFFPLALPGISGPGTIAAVIGISTEIAELKSPGLRAAAYSATVAAILSILAIVWLVMRFAPLASRFVGAEGLNVATRLTGFLLVCIGVQFVGSGVRTFLAGA